MKYGSLNWCLFRSIGSLIQFDRDGHLRGITVVLGSFNHGHGHEYVNKRHNTSPYIAGTPRPRSSYFPGFICWSSSAPAPIWPGACGHMHGAWRGPPLPSHATAAPRIRRCQSCCLSVGIAGPVLRIWSAPAIASAGVVGAITPRAARWQGRYQASGARPIPPVPEFRKGMRQCCCFTYYFYRNTVQASY